MAREAIAPVPAGDAHAPRILVDPKFWKSRVDVCAAFHTWLRQRDGWIDGERLPWGAILKFSAERLTWPKAIEVKSEVKRRRLAQWFRRWQDEGRPGQEDDVMRSAAGKVTWSSAWMAKGDAAGHVDFKRRQRRSGGGVRVKANWVRESLFEWFVQMRFSIDWKEYNDALRKAGRHKAMGRFPPSLLYMKARQFLQDYCAACLRAGVSPVAMQLRARWLRTWAREYGLCLRAPNRRYKVSKRVLAERLEIEWLNGARVRQLCLCAHGYEPEHENFDQSPYQHNAVGSQNTAKTLAVAGCTVPLIEGHAATRARWTANLTTFSDTKRITEMAERGEFPYAECMFRADGQRLQATLREHIRSRGYGRWVSAATSEKGSYREADILQFLDNHLPLMTAERRWRIMWADDFAPHKSDNVKRMCWHRGYVGMHKGGGRYPSDADSRHRSQLSCEKRLYK